jgi:hypothetical protein
MEICMALEGCMEVSWLVLYESETRVCSNIEDYYKIEINWVFIFIEVDTDRYFVSGEWSRLLQF